MGKKVNTSLATSLRDGRTVWLEGKQVPDVTTHPAFQGTIQTLTKLLNMLDEPDTKRIVGFQNNQEKHFTHLSFLIPKSLEQLQQRREAFTLWAKSTFGVMSRLSEYANSLITGYYMDRHEFASYDTAFVDKITAFYEQARQERRIVTTAILDPQIDRSITSGAQTDPDALLRIVNETTEGVVVRGAKMIATAAPYAHDVLVMPHQPLAPTQEDSANVFIVPLNLPGLNIVCRESFASSDPEKHPLSAHFDEMDAVLIFDDVLIPWERVLLHRSPEGAYQAQRHQQSNVLAQHQTVVRLLVKLQFIAGIATAIAQSIGADHHLHVQEKLGELYTQIDSIEALLLASEIEGSKSKESNAYLPASTPLQTARNLGTRYYPRAIEILKQIGAGGYMQLPSAAWEEDHPLTPFLKKYYKGAHIDAKTKTALFQIGWELVGSTLGSRHDLYERFYTGDPVRTFAQQFDDYNFNSAEARLSRFWQDIRGKGQTNGTNSLPATT